MQRMDVEKVRIRLCWLFVEETQAHHNELLGFWARLRPLFFTIFHYFAVFVTAKGPLNLTPKVHMFVSLYSEFSIYSSVDT